MEENINMIKYDFTYPSSNCKTNIHAIICYPKSGQYNRIIQIIHGKREYIERYLNFMEYLTTKGFITVGHDHLGHGQSINTKEDLGYIGETNPNELLIKDIHTLRTLIQKKFPNFPYFILGHSMGSFLLREYISLCGNDLAGAIILGTGHKNKYKVTLGLRLCEIISCFKGNKYKSKFIDNLSKGKNFEKFDMTKTDIYKSHITSDPLMAKQYNEDQKRNFDFSLNAYIGLFDAIIYSCDQNNINKINKDLPILFVSGGDDPVGNFGKGVKTSYEMFKKAGIKDVIMKLYEKDRHEVLNEVNREEVFEYIKNWIDERTLLYKENKRY